MFPASKPHPASDDRDDTYPFAVDILIPASGLSERALTLIETCMFRCRGPVERWSYAAEIDGPVVCRWAARIGFGVSAEADWAAAMLMEVDAKRVR